MCFVDLFLTFFINDIEFSRDLISSMGALLNSSRGIFSHAAQAQTSYLQEKQIDKKKCRWHVYVKD